LFHIRKHTHSHETHNNWDEKTQTNRLRNIQTERESKRENIQRERQREIETLSRERHTRAKRNINRETEKHTDRETEKHTDTEKERRLR